MLIALIVLKIIFLFLGVRWTIVNVGKMLYKQRVPSTNILYQTIGIVGFVVIQFNMFQ